MLTHQQQRCLVFIAGYQARTGYSPSQEEMRAGLALSSKSQVNRLVRQLVSRGRVRKLFHKARAIEIVGPVPIGTVPLGTVPRVDMTGPGYQHLVWDPECDGDNKFVPLRRAPESG